ncbi:MAG: sugar ABC transporter substrate-binding protein [Candidatus Weimeria sp.]
MKGKKFIALATAVFVAAGLMACGGSASKASGSGSGKKDTDDADVVEYIAPDSSEGASKAFSDALRERAEKKKLDLRTDTTGYDIDSQVKEIEKAKKAGYGGLIVWAADPSTAHQLEIAAGDMPIVFVNSEPDEDDLEEGKYVYVGSPDDKAGEYEAEYVYNKLGKPSSLKLVLLKGKKSSSSTQERVDAIKRYFTLKKVDVDYVFSDYGDDSSADTFLLLKSFKLTGKTFDAVICTSDEMAFGAMQYATMNGIDISTIPICGVGGANNAIAKVATGDLSFTAGADSEAQAKAAVSAIQALMNGESIKDIKNASADGRYIWIPYRKIDQENAGKYLQ